MLCDASGNAFAPKSKTGGLEGAAHVINHLRFGKSGYFADVVEAGAVVPCHADEGVGSLGGKFGAFHDREARLRRQASEQ